MTPDVQDNIVTFKTLCLFENARPTSTTIGDPTVDC